MPLTFLDGKTKTVANPRVHNPQDTKEGLLFLKKYRALSLTILFLLNRNNGRQMTTC